MISFSNFDLVIDIKAKLAARQSFCYIDCFRFTNYLFIACFIVALGACASKATKHVETVNTTALQAHQFSQVFDIILNDTICQLHNSNSEIVSKTSGSSLCGGDATTTTVRTLRAIVTAKGQDTIQKQSELQVLQAKEKTRPNSPVWYSESTYMLILFPLSVVLVVYLTRKI